MKQDLKGVLLAYNDIINKGFDGHLFINGLAAHFRDLMMSKDPETVVLLEVGENAQQKYISQAQNCTLQYLMNALEICSQADTAYRTSKNQRLTVEIALMQLASLVADPSLKKKDLA